MQRAPASSSVRSSASPRVLGDRDQHARLPLEGAVVASCAASAAPVPRPTGPPGRVSRPRAPRRVRRLRRRQRRAPCRPRRAAAVRERLDSAPRREHEPVASATRPRARRAAAVVAIASAVDAGQHGFGAAPRELRRPSRRNPLRCASSRTRRPGASFAAARSRSHCRVELRPELPHRACPDRRPDARDAHVPPRSCIRASSVARRRRTALQ